MNIHLRLLRVFAGALIRRTPPGSVLDPFTTPMRVWPMDLDFNLHQNNGRYLSCMDIGRMDMAFRAGLHRPMLKHKWMPLLGSSTIRYFKSLGPFQKFDPLTRIVGSDEKWIFMEQKFVSGGHLYAIGTVKVLFRGPKGNVPTATLMELTGVEQGSPDLPQWIADWHKADRAMAAHGRSKGISASPQGSN